MEMDLDNKSYSLKAPWECLVVLPGLGMCVLIGGAAVNILLGVRDTYAFYGDRAGGNSILGADAEFLRLMYQLVTIICWEAIALWGVLGVIIAYVCVRRLLEHRRWLLVTSREGITLTDWRGHRIQIPWNKITAVCLKTRWYLGFSHTAVVRGYEQDIRLPSWINRREALLQEIVDQAGLDKRSEYTYLRP